MQIKSIFSTIIIFCTLLFSCINSSSKKNHNDKATAPKLIDGFYGVSFDTSNAIGLAEALKKYNSNSENNKFKIKGSIDNVCQGEGCWLSINDGEESQIVEFENDFVVDKDIKGLETIVDGSFYKDTISVEQQIEDALSENSNISKEELKNKFDSPKINIGFKATGVKLLK